MLRNANKPANLEHCLEHCHKDGTHHKAALSQGTQHNSTTLQLHLTLKQEEEVITLQKRKCNRTHAFLSELLQDDQHDCTHTTFVVGDPPVLQLMQRSAGGTPRRDGQSVSLTIVVATIYLGLVLLDQHSSCCRRYITSKQQQNLTLPR